MSVTGTNHFAKLHTVEVGEVSEYLSIEDKRVLPALNRRVWRDTSEIVKRVRTGFRSDVEKIVQFAEKHFNTQLPEVRAECKPIIDRITLRNTEETKQKIAGKLFRQLFALSQNGMHFNREDIPIEIGLTYLTVAARKCLDIQMKIQTAFELPAAEKLRALVKVVQELLSQNRVIEAEEVIPLIEDLQQQALQQCWVVAKYSKLNQTQEAIRVMKKVPEGADKRSCWDSIISSYVDSNQYVKAIDFVKSLVNVELDNGPEFLKNFHIVQCALLHIVNRYAENGLLEEAIDLLTIWSDNEAVIEERGMVSERQMSILRKESASKARGKITAELSSRGHYEEAARQISLMTSETPKMEATLKLALLMAERGWVEEVVALVEKIPRDLDLKRFVTEVDKIASAFIRLGRPLEAAEMIKLLYTEIPESDEVWLKLYRRTMNSAVVTEIKNLIATGSLTNAAFLVEQLAVKFARDGLRQEILFERFNRFFKF